MTSKLNLLETLPLRLPLPFPPGQTEESLLALFSSMELVGSPKQELENYWRQDWRRFVYTYGLVQQLTGRCLELGANPYFTTTLLQLFTDLELTLANYFGSHFDSESSQVVSISSPESGATKTSVMNFSHFNIEDASFPFPDMSFDVIMLCEVLEHLQSDPLKVLLEIKRVLKPDGSLILTTPNVSRLENVCRMLAGVNIYDPYSGYGAYGRHNREYNKHELSLLLDYCGFETQELFSSDVHDNQSANLVQLEPIIPLLRPREHDLGQYLFSRSINSRPAKSKRPAWLFRSYPPDELES